MLMSPQDISKKYKSQSLAMSKTSPPSSTKISGHLSRHYIFIPSHDMCYSWSVIFCFAFSFVFVFLLQYVVGSQHVSLERNKLRFHCLEHSSFHSYCCVSVHILIVLRLALVFHSYYVQSLLDSFSFLLLSLWSFMNVNFESCFK